jgi:hypothetical protein
MPQLRVQSGEVWAIQMFASFGDAHQYNERTCFRPFSPIPSNLLGTQTTNLLRRLSMLIYSLQICISRASLMLFLFSENPSDLRKLFPMKYNPFH